MLPQVRVSASSFVLPPKTPPGDSVWGFMMWEDLGLGLSNKPVSGRSGAAEGRDEFVGVRNGMESNQKRREVTVGGGFGRGST